MKKVAREAAIAIQTATTQTPPAGKGGIAPPLQKRQQLEKEGIALPLHKSPQLAEGGIAPPLHKRPQLQGGV